MASLQPSNMTAQNIVFCRTCVTNGIVANDEFSYKCSICDKFVGNSYNETTKNKKVIEHCKSEEHVLLVKRTKINCDTLPDEICSLAVNNKILISLGSLAMTMHEKPARFFSFCFICTKLVMDGVHGIEGHVNLMSHKKPDHKLCDDYCSTCRVTVSVLKTHVESKFHKKYVDYLSYYGVNKTNEEIKKKDYVSNMPNTFSSVSHYVQSMIPMIIKEQQHQKEICRSLIMTNITIRWEGNVRPGGPMKAFFVPIESDNENLIIKIGDELVISSASNYNWTTNGCVIETSSFSKENICVKLINNNGVCMDLTYPYNIWPKWRDTVFWRQRSAMTTLKEKFEEFKFLLPALLNQPTTNKNDDSISEENESDVVIDNFEFPVNQSQRKAIEMALKYRLLLIQGPPGTGKTETTVLIVRNIIKSTSTKVLVCAHSNMAVDLLAEKLDAAGVELIRLFSRKYENLKHPLKRLGLIEQVLKNNDKLKNNYDKFIKKKMKPEEEYIYSDELSTATENFFSRVQVVCCTLITAGAEDFKLRKYDVVIIDEASQATEPECLVPVVMHLAQKLILIGDHKQLGPVVKSETVKKARFEISLFERLMSQNVIPSVMLGEQYRMHPKIANFTSKEFYDNKVKNGISADKRLMPFPFFGEKDQPIIFFDIEGIEEQVGTSYRNSVEAEKVLDIIKQIHLLKLISLSQVGVISPYEGQRRKIMQLFAMETDWSFRQELQKLKVANIDGYQGQERDVIIVSFVRCNEKGSVGFLKDVKRINVSLTRAKYKLIVIGHRKTLSSNKHYHNFLTYV